MARAYASIVVDAPVEAVWAIVRDFNAMPSWNPGIATSAIEDGLASDVVGCVRAFTLADGAFVRERLISLDDSRYRFSYNFETPAFPVENYLATMRLHPVTKGDRTFVEWEASFDEAPADRGRYVDIVSNAVFAAGLSALAKAASGAAPPPGAARWQGLRPAKVYCASTLKAPVEAVWREMRDFAGMDGWHPAITGMAMREGARSDKVSGVRDFLFGTARLWEELTYLCDRERAFRYRILRSENPWLNYHAGARLRPVTATGETFAVWTADWTASPQDDLTLVPTVHHDVFQLAFDTLEAKLRLTTPPA